MRNTNSLFPVLNILILPTIGTLSAMYWFPDSVPGNAIYGFCRLSILAVPLLWLKFAEKYKFKRKPVSLKHILSGVGSGIVISIFIIAAYKWLGHTFADNAVISEKLSDIGVKSTGIFVLGFIYWVFLNSLLEEFVWRFFLIRSLGRMLPAFLTIPASALMFTLHHFFVLRFYLDLTSSLFWSGCIFFAGIIWAIHYRISKSVIPGFISHAIADAAIFYVGAKILGIC